MDSDFESSSWDSSSQSSTSGECYVCHRRVNYEGSDYAYSNLCGDCQQLSLSDAESGSPASSVYSRGSGMWTRIEIGNSRDAMDAGWNSDDELPGPEEVITLEFLRRYRDRHLGLGSPRLSESNFRVFNEQTESAPDNEQDEIVYDNEQRYIDTIVDHLAEIESVRRVSVGASRSFVKNLPRIKMNAELMSESNASSCPICMESFTVGMVVNQLPCSHLYHPPCIMPWLETKNTCPLCRYLLPIDGYLPNRFSARNILMNRWVLYAAPVASISLMLWLRSGTRTR